MGEEMQIIKLKCRGSSQKLSIPKKNDLLHVYLAEFQEMDIIISNSLKQSSETELLDKNHADEDLIIEDEVMIAEDLAETCRSFGYEVLEPAFDPGDALSKLNCEEIDLVILDINLESSIDGIELAEYINEHLNLPFVYLTSYSDPQTVDKARRTKPMAYLTKPFRKADIFATIEIAMQNFTHLHKKGFPSIEEVNQSLLNTITRREYQLLLAIHRGKSNQEISEVMNISINTVKSHLKNCYIKLGVNSRVSALSKIRKY